MLIYASNDYKYSMPDRPSPGTTTSAHPIGKIQERCDKSTTGLNNILTQQKTTQRRTTEWGKFKNLRENFIATDGIL